jgi:hypothetical protein
VQICTFVPLKKNCTTSSAFGFWRRGRLHAAAVGWGRQSMCPHSIWTPRPHSGHVLGERGSAGGDWGQGWAGDVVGFEAAAMHDNVRESWWRSAVVRSQSV